MNAPCVTRLAASLLAAVALSSGEPAAAAAPAHDALQWFRGTWVCTTTLRDPKSGVARTTRSTWHFRRIPGDSPWMDITYGSREEGGHAIAGYVPALKAYVYRDFHADGAYAESDSPSPSAGRWIWTGVFYPEGGAAPLHGRVIYTESGTARYERTFEQQTAAGFKRLGGDHCDRR